MSLGFAINNFLLERRRAIENSQILHKGRMHLAEAESICASWAKWRNINWTCLTPDAQSENAVQEEFSEPSKDFFVHCQKWKIRWCTTQVSNPFCNRWATRTMIFNFNFRQLINRKREYVLITFITARNSMLLLNWELSNLSFPWGT